MSYLLYCLQIQYAKTGLDGVKDMAEEKYELVHTKVVDTWGQITVETGEGIEELPEVSTLACLQFCYTGDKNSTRPLVSEI